MNGVVQKQLWIRGNEDTRQERGNVLVITSNLLFLQILKDFYVSAFVVAIFLSCATLLPSRISAPQELRNVINLAI